MTGPEKSPEKVFPLRYHHSMTCNANYDEYSFQETNYGHCDDEREGDGYCTGGSANNDRCNDRQLKNERHVYGGDSSDEEEESLEVLVKFF